ncbi:hypothetical protein BZG36_02829 [Bifiguratus adelaidae]|uniref:Uncharacterized protein n=1 Tax=Bifiguratus adelaidae TaxID=1938954 RepID=A0A261Y0N5_9FUNG|nr:hypothetical protein BZG36_02829 [Bifiguratus adelaidae]
MQTLSKPWKRKFEEDATVSKRPRHDASQHVAPRETSRTDSFESHAANLFPRDLVRHDVETMDGAEGVHRGGAWMVPSADDASPATPQPSTSEATFLTTSSAPSETQSFILSTSPRPLSRDVSPPAMHPESSSSIKRTKSASIPKRLSLRSNKVNKDEDAEQDSMEDTETAPNADTLDSAPSDAVMQSPVDTPDPLRLSDPIPILPDNEPLPPLTCKKSLRIQSLIDQERKPTAADEARTERAVLRVLRTTEPEDTIALEDAEMPTTKPRSMSMSGLRGVLSSGIEKSFGMKTSIWTKFRDPHGSSTITPATTPPASSPSLPTLGPPPSPTLGRNPTESPIGPSRLRSASVASNSSIHSKRRASLSTGQRARSRSRSISSNLSFTSGLSTMTNLSNGSVSAQSLSDYLDKIGHALFHKHNKRTDPSTGTLDGTEKQPEATDDHTWARPISPQPPQPDHPRSFKRKASTSSVLSDSLPHVYPKSPPGSTRTSIELTEPIEDDPHTFHTPIPTWLKSSPRKKRAVREQKLPFDISELSLREALE